MRRMCPGHARHQRLLANAWIAMTFHHLSNNRLIQVGLLLPERTVLDHMPVRLYNYQKHTLKIACHKMNRRVKAIHRLFRDVSRFKNNRLTATDLRR